jgi:hypothetical protein
MPGAFTRVTHSYLKHKHRFKQTKDTRTKTRDDSDWEAFVMAIIALLGLSVGAFLALRWNVLVLVPAIGIALPLVALIGIARGEGAGSLALDMLVAVTCIEAGYIARLLAGVFADAARAVMKPAIVNKASAA